MKVIHALGAGVLSIAALSGCSSNAPDMIDHKIIEANILKTLHSPKTSTATCPDGLRAQPGALLECVLKDATGLKTMIWVAYDGQKDGKDVYAVSVGVPPSVTATKSAPAKSSSTSHSTTTPSAPRSSQTVDPTANPT